MRKKTLSKQAFLDYCLQTLLLEARLSSSNIDTSFSTHKYIHIFDTLKIPYLHLSDPLVLELMEERTFLPSSASHSYL